VRVTLRSDSCALSLTLCTPPPGALLSFFLPCERISPPFASSKRSPFLFCGASSRCRPPPRNKKQIALPFSFLGVDGQLLPPEEASPCCRKGLLPDKAFFLFVRYSGPRPVPLFPPPVTEHEIRAPFLVRRHFLFL